mgnify:CR=1 FL=1|tara:strand:- start:175 stop:501 length:327 start_codon:yes stop_codon:yes gene_type:complete
MTRTILIVTALALAAGCTSAEDRVLFDGYYFPIKVRKVEGQRDHITIEVRDAARSIEGAREAGRYAAVSYCVGTYGSSDIQWIAGPDTLPERLRLVDGALRLEGICPQ